VIGVSGQTVDDGIRPGTDGFNRGRDRIEGAEAIVVSLPLFARKGYLTENLVRGFIKTSARTSDGVPFFVFSPKDGVITLIESGFDPKEVDFE
jgi:hypothetical protein